MYKAIRSYTRKAERKHEVTQPRDSYGFESSSVDGGAAGKNAQVVPADGGRAVGAWSGQAFSESSSFEQHEHYERKLQRVKKTRADRDREARRRKLVSTS